jgi:chemotaxis protein histidine kinase CheA
MSDTIDNQELMKVFNEEAQSLIDEMRKSLTDLHEELKAKEIGRKAGGEIQSPLSEPAVKPDILHRLFRCAHTIKSSSRSVGFNALEEISQALEKVFKEAIDYEFKFDADLIPLFSESVEICQKLLNEEEVAGFKDALERLKNIPHYKKR